MILRSCGEGSENKMSIFGNVRTGLWSCQIEVVAQHPTTTDRNFEGLSGIETSCLGWFARTFLFLLKLETHSQVSRSINKTLPVKSCS